MKKHNYKAKRIDECLNLNGIISGPKPGTFKVKRASNAVYVNKKGLTKFIKTGKVSGLKLYKAGTSYVRLKLFP